MKTIYFISGLGSTEESVQILNTELNKYIWIRDKIFGYSGTVF